MTVSNRGASNGPNVVTAAAHRMSPRLNGEADQWFTKLLMLEMLSLCLFMITSMASHVSTDFDLIFVSNFNIVQKLTS